MNNAFNQYGLASKQPLGLGIKRKMSHTKPGFTKVSSQAVLRKPFDLNQNTNSNSIQFSPSGAIGQSYHTKQIHKENQNRQSGIFIAPSFQKIEDRKSNYSQQKRMVHRNTPLPLNNNLVNIDRNRFNFRDSRQSIRSQGTPFSYGQFSTKAENANQNTHLNFQAEQKLEKIQIQYSEKLRQAAQQIQRLNNLLEKKDKQNQILRKRINEAQIQRQSSEIGMFGNKQSEIQRKLISRIETLIKQNTIINEQLRVSNQKVQSLRNQLRLKNINIESNNQYRIRQSFQASQSFLKSNYNQSNNQIGWNLNLDQQIHHSLEILKRKSIRKQSQIQLLESKLNSAQSQLNYLRVKYQGILVQIENMHISPIL